jgi:hypothetical protein
LPIAIAIAIATNGYWLRITEVASGGLPVVKAANGRLACGDCCRRRAAGGRVGEYGLTGWQYMDVDIVKESYDASGVTLVISVKMAHGESLPPIPGFPDEQMLPPRSRLLRAVLGREISALFWGRTAPPRPPEPIVKNRFVEHQSA